MLRLLLLHCKLNQLYQSIKADNTFFFSLSLMDDHLFPEATAASGHTRTQLLHMLTYEPN
jgi:hypothetical protein